MEVTRARVLLLTTGLAACALTVTADVPRHEVRTERWMEESLPAKVAGKNMVRSASNSRQSYRVDNDVYQALKPYGIVCRVYGTRKWAVDAVVVAGNDPRVFHDPMVCFPSHEWAVTRTWTVDCPTRTRGLVRLSLVELHSSEGTRLGAYCYKLSDSVMSTRADFAWRWALGELMGESRQEGAFYRFVQIAGPASKARMIKFVGNFLDAASDRSHGEL
ncbi:MAG: exosortase-associated EpsI family protein [Verrucomicrobiaceae bacterium]|nr:MAG: exosortase-associated EpsI family protein [Verrucomicrobiaceae bacterium]